jgi:hypothetical protein
MQTTEARRDSRTAALITGAAVLLVAGVALGGLLVVMVAVAAAVMAAAVVGGHPSTRRRIAARAERRRRLVRRERRELLLEQASLPREPLSALTDVVTRIEHEDPRAADRLELSELLDTYVQLALAQQRLERMIGAVPRSSLALALDGLRDCPGDAAEIRRECLVRRIHLWDECRASADRCAAEMATISELIRMLGDRQVVHGEPIPTIEPALARRLEEVTDHEASLRELTGD